MKLLFALLLAVGVAGAARGQGTTTAPEPAPKKATPARIELAPGAKKDAKADAKKNAGKAAKPEAKKKEDEIGTVEGMAIPRGEGFLGLQLIDGKFKLTFYNAKKKPVAPDVGRAALRWDPKYKVGIERAMLLPAGAHALASEKFVRPPYNFKLTIVLLKDNAEVAEGAEPGGETIVVDFKP